jgi:hypothetical protein
MINYRTPVIYVGYDVRDHRAYDVLHASIRKHATKEYPIIPLVEPVLRRIGLFRRTHKTFAENPKQKYDFFDGKPYSTDFTFTRFLVPHLNLHSGLALFMDADMFLRSDVREIFEVYGKNKEYAVQVVKHKYSPPEGVKLDGVAQTRYNRKNWSSFILWNCDHQKNRDLTVDDVNLRSGSWLHSFGWLEDDEIGSINEEWNWLDGHSPELTEAKNVHFTTGGPWFSEWKGERKVDEYYAAEWLDFEQEQQTKLLMESF